MTRKRSNLKNNSDDKSDQFKNGPPAAPRRDQKKIDFTQAILCENWKQQALVKKNIDYTALCSMMHMIQVAGALGLVAFAAGSGGAFIPPAICAAGYTVATISNSFDRDLHGVVGSLDSPFAITALCALLLYSFTTGPAGAMGFLTFSLCSIPFFIDMFISLQFGFKRYFSQGSQNSDTITFEVESDQNFINMNETPRREETDMYDIQDRLLPDFAADGGALNRLVAYNWKENAYRETSDTMKQLSAFALICAYFYAGGIAVESGDNTALGALSLGYAGSSLLGYFGLATQPVMRMMRLNAVPAIGAAAGAMSLMSNAPNVALLSLIAMFLFDSMQGVMQQHERMPVIDDQEFERVNTEEAEEEHGPIVSFFLESWKVNSFSKKNFEMSQIMQILLFGGQLFCALICMIDGGGSIGLLSVILAMIVASSYSFFSPVKVSAIDALQSNGAQLAVLGTATHHIVTTNPATSFYALFALLAIDTMMSCQSFFEQHSNQMGQQAASHMGLLEKDPRSGGREWERQ